MAPDRTLKKIIAEARLEKLSRRYGQAAHLFEEGARTQEGKDAEMRRRLVRQQAACTYLDDGTPKANRASQAISLLLEFYFRRR